MLSEDNWNMLSQDVLPAIIRGEFMHALNQFDSLFQAVPVEEIPPGVFMKCGMTRYFSGDFEGAILDFNQAIANNSQLGGSHASLAYIFACCPDEKLHNAELAIKLALQSCELSHWKQWEALQILSAAYARAGNFEEAEEYAMKALEIAPRNKELRSQRLISFAKDHQAYTADLAEDFIRWRDDFIEKHELNLS